MQSANSYEKLKKFSVLYGLIVFLANLVGVFVPRFFQTKYNAGPADELFSQFIESHGILFKHLTAVNFIFPMLFCILYSHPRKQEKYPKRFVNSPIMLSLLGSTGWAIAFITELSSMIAARYKLGIDVTVIITRTVIFDFLAALLTFTVSFFAVELVHRHYILPAYFPEAHFDKYNYKVRPSLKVMFYIVYATTSVFPVVYLFSILAQANAQNPGIIPLKSLFLVLFLVITGLFVQINFTRYISTPLKKLREKADDIKNGINSEKIDFISNDDLGTLTDSFNDMNESLTQKTNKINTIQNSVIKGMAMMVESRDNSTGGHINRTSAYVQLFAQRLFETGKYPEISKSFIENLIKAAPMHDLGKITVDDAVLRKPGKFTDEEYAIMQTHAAEGAKIVAGVLNEVDNHEFKKIAINVAHYHHEKWNGSGYPEKISGTEIPLEARIMALADVYDALVSRRCYKEQFDFDKAFDIIKESSGTHFDPSLAEEFLNLRAEMETLTNILSD